MELRGNVALVTGGASGLGEATTRHLHARGAKVFVFDRDTDRAEALAGELGERIGWCGGDVRSEVDTAAAVAGAAELGDLRVVVACAGGALASGRIVGRDGTPFALDSFQTTLDVNVVGTFNTMRLGAAHMSTLDGVGDDGERGVVVTVGSIAGYEGQIGQLPYAAAKAGIIGMTIVAARDLAAVGIRVNCIAPGTMDTRAWGQAPPGMREPLEAKVPFPRRFGHDTEFAELAEHLVTNRYLNGTVVRLDGGIRFDPK